jgi:glycosyltransferase involved in cell wall biosynthesis
MKPSLSVVMAVYNAEQYLQKSVKSILGQTFSDFEFIIIDDGSTDRSFEMISSYDDPRIRIIQNSNNLGQTRSLNKGIAISSGEFIARQDADDYSDLDRFRLQVDHLKAHPEVGLLGTSYRIVDKQGNILETVVLPESNDELQDRLLRGNIFCHGSVMIRGDVLKMVGGYNENFPVTQDYELWLRLSEHASLANLKSVLYSLRFDEGSVTRKRRTVQLSYRRLALELAEQRRRNESQSQIPEDVEARYPAEPERVAGDARWAAYLFYVSGDLAKGEDLLRLAVAVLAASPNGKPAPLLGRWNDWAITRAHALSDQRRDVKAGEDFIKWALKIVSSDPANTRRSIARYYADRVFIADRFDESQPLIHYYLKAIMLDPAYLQNRGLLVQVWNALRKPNEPRKRNHPSL